jgi:hypothetical protein
MLAPCVGEKVVITSDHVGRIWSLLKDQSVRVEPSYINPGRGEAYRVPVGDYLENIGWFADRDLMCPETRVFLPDSLEGLGLREIANSDDPCPVTMVHLGFAGAASPIHFDWDFRSVLHLNIRGAKSLAVAHPDGGSVLPTLINSIPFDLARLPRRSRGHVLGMINASTTALAAGEGVKFSSLWWHAAMYRRPSLSMSYRFNELRHLRPISYLPRSAELQRVAWLAAETPALVAEGLVDEVVRLFLRPAPSWRRRYKQFLSGLDEIEERLRRQLGKPALASRFPRHLRSVPDFASREMKNLYGMGAMGADSGTRGRTETWRLCSYIFAHAETALSQEEQEAVAKHAFSAGRRPPVDNG